MLRERCARLLVPKYILDGASWHLVRGIGEHFAAFCRFSDRYEEHHVYCLHYRPPQRDSDSPHAARRSPGHRQFSTSTRAEAATETEGPPKGKITALSFRETTVEAERAFENYHNQNFFLTQPSAGLQKVKESFLPFWVTTAAVQVTLKGAQLGFDSWVSVYNPATRRFEQQLRTSWRQVRLRQTWERSYSASEEGMQVYASYKYSRAEMQRLRPGRLVTQATEFTPRMLTSASTGETRRVGPFHMKPNTALRFVSEWMRSQEADAAEDMLRRSFDCDRVAGVDMEVSITSMRSSPLYVPAYIFRSQHFGTKMRTFVSGVNSEQVAGARAYDEGKIAVLAGLAAGAGMALSQGLAALASAQALIWGVALPMTLAGIATHYLTWLRARWAAFWQQTEQSRDAEGNRAGAWDAQWVHAYSQYEEQRRRMDEQENAQFYGASGQAGSGRDPLGYYQLMGLEPGCSKQEIQEVARGTDDPVGALAAQGVYIRDSAVCYLTPCQLAAITADLEAMEDSLAVELTSRLVSDCLMRAAAFRGLAMKWHPDKVDEQDKAAASRRFQRLNEAYSVLRDPAKRRQYDARL